MYTVNEIAMTLWRIFERTAAKVYSECVRGSRGAVRGSGGGLRARVDGHEHYPLLNSLLLSY